MKLNYLFLCLFHITTSVRSQFKNNCWVVNTESGNMALRENQVKQNSREAMKVLIFPNMFCDTQIWASFAKLWHKLGKPIGSKEASKPTMNGR